MSFLLDTNICSAHLKDERLLFHRFVQHAGNLYVSHIIDRRRLVGAVSALL